ncbi:MAG: peptide ABC transporter substrate-binding protein [Chlamydiia bacterium]|nr:peptide ABC transporter substrate-binding protein [Chlamydiia bacterium]
MNRSVRLSVNSDPAILDPRRARDLDSITLIHMLFEGLTRADSEGALEMALAEKVSVTDSGRRYTFRLRKSYWSNGEPVTASDFVSSWKTLLDPQFATDMAYQLYPIKNAKEAKLGRASLDTVGVLAENDQTLVVDLESPLPYFLELLSMPSFFPVHAKTVAQYSDWCLVPERFVSNGPFCLQSWQHSDKLVFAKNPKYWEAETVQLEGVQIFVAAPDTSLRMYEEGKLDWAGSPLSSIPADAIASLKQGGALQISPFCGTYFYRLNTEEMIGGKKNPLSDTRVRRLLGVSLDREGIVKHVLQGGQEPAYTLVPPQMGLERKDLMAQPLDGFDLFQEPLVISYSNTERNASVAQAVQRRWKEKLGIEVLLEAVEPKVFFQRVSKKEYQIAAGSWTADFNDPVNFLEVFKYKGASTNNTGWERAEYVDLLDKSALCTEMEERKHLLSQAERVLMDDMPILPIFHFALNYLKREDLEKVSLSSMGQLDMRWAFFQTGQKSGPGLQ